MTDAQEKLGQAIDRLDNVAHTVQLNLPARISMEALQIILPEIVVQLKSGFIESIGENPWES